jgi:hypothetical protein
MIGFSGVVKNTLSQRRKVWHSSICSYCCHIPVISLEADEARICIMSLTNVYLVIYGIERQIVSSSDRVCGL